MTEDLLGQGLTHSHQEDGPVNGVETQNVFTDQMHIGGPQLLVQFGGILRIVADTGDVVVQSVHPNVYNVTRVEINRNTPAEGGTGYAQILQTGLQEVVYHFFLTGLGLNEFRMLLDVLHQTILIFAHFEEVSFLFGLFNFAAAVGALAVHQLALGEEGFTGYAVPAFVVTFVNVALLVQFLEDLLYGLFVVGIGGTDELVIAGVHQIPNVFDLAGYFVNVLLGSYTVFLSVQLDLLAVFVGTGHEEYIVALQTTIAGNGIGQNYLIGVADMGLTGSVSNSGCQVILTFGLFVACITHGLNLLFDIHNIRRPIQ